MRAMLGMLLLAQAVALRTPAPAAAQEPAPLDSARLARLSARVQGQDAVRARMAKGWVELTRPRLVEAAVAYREAWPDRVDVADTTVPNPLPLAQLQALQVRGKSVLVPAVLGGLALGVSALGSALLSKALNPQTAPQGSTIVQVTFLGLGIGAAAGAADGLLRTRWVTVYKRGERRGGDSNPR